MVDLVNAFYGLQWDAEAVATLGRAVLKEERDFNRRAGFSAQDDRLPEFFMTEPLKPHNITFQVGDEALDSVFNF